MLLCIHGEVADVDTEVLTVVHRPRGGGHAPVDTPSPPPALLPADAVELASIQQVVVTPSPVLPPIQQQQQQQPSHMYVSGHTESGMPPRLSPSTSPQIALVPLSYSPDHVGVYSSVNKRARLSYDDGYDGRAASLTVTVDSPRESWSYDVQRGLSSYEIDVDLERERERADARRREDALRSQGMMLRRPWQDNDDTHAAAAAAATRERDSIERSMERERSMVRTGRTPLPPLESLIGMRSRSGTLKRSLSPE